MSAMQRILGVAVVFALGFGVRAAFDDYRDTEHSRVPVGTRPSAAPVASVPVLKGDPGLPSAPVTELTLYPTVDKGLRTPFDLWRYYGRGRTSFGSPVLPMRFDQWLAFHEKQKPQLMADVRAYMDARFDLSGAAVPGVTQSGGKPVMAGPVARLPDGVPSWEALGELPPETIREQDLFPFKPLAHPLQSTAHMLFPDSWVAVHPEHARIDVDHDIPDAYLPDFPPPMYLTTHKELGDVTRGQEVTFDNFHALFDGLLTAEQMEGLKELLRPTPTTWFNTTEHRVTVAPSRGVACFDCHVNGHTNGAVELGPDSRPNLARLRTDTPTMRGNYNLMQLSSKRSIRSMDHFAEVEEYFDGDPGMQQAIGPRGVKREVTNRMGDFNALLDYPPAPKLGPLGRLIPSKATAAELRGEALFRGKARCVQCHDGPAFVDDYMHDLQVERFYVGRPEGPIKTFPLRGIKDSPPYLHDGRLLTLDDAVAFFSLVLELHLTEAEQDDLVAFLLCL
ncbi:MAG: cytochrome C [Alphaproteobacteria bacterium]|nr:cytochrome C [Alphaproteobacteria bacterium]